MWARFDTLWGKLAGRIGPELFPRTYFEQVYASKPDPWSCATSDYEQRKYERTLAAIPPRWARRVLEIGCGEGVFSQSLAPRVHELVGVDLSETALIRARARCAGSNNATFRRFDVTQERLAGGFDAVIAAEVLYYLGHGRRYRETAINLATAVERGIFVFVHPIAIADRVAEPFLALEGVSRLVRHLYSDGRAYCIDVLGKFVASGT
jgi:cyclopropane fatty-acyl-phospholipid synthase-like methyltransferase